MRSARSARHTIEHEEEILAWTRSDALPLEDSSDLDPLMNAIGDARFVLLGEASHGTSEYYAWRARLSRRLIEERGFSFIAVEGDWPDCYKVNRYVKGVPDSGASARNVLHAFERWPTWMWANREVVTLVEWLEEHNRGREEAAKAGFYGLDVYSLWDSLHAVLTYLERVDPQALPAARRAMECFEPYGEDAQEYARATALVPSSCEDEVVALLTRLRKNAASYREDGRDAFFNAEQNALVARNAERYYRSMVAWGPDSWNIRDHHMVETLHRLMDAHGASAKAIVWEHNTHIGDARATDMASAGMVNVGQLVRESHPRNDVFTVGFGSYHGRVMAAPYWGAPMERMHVPPAREGSIEELLHRAGTHDKLLLLEEARDVAAWHVHWPHRAIGVVYDPERERAGNYVPSALVERYDAFLYLDHTHALHPLHMHEEEGHEPPETYPFGF